MLLAPFKDMTPRRQAGTNPGCGRPVRADGGGRRMRREIGRHPMHSLPHVCCCTPQLHQPAARPLLPCAGHQHIEGEGARHGNHDCLQGHRDRCWQKSTVGTCTRQQSSNAGCYCSGMRRKHCLFGCRLCTGAPCQCNRPAMVLAFFMVLPAGGGWRSVS